MSPTPAPIDFYFDFSSPYGYLASHRIDAIAARHVRTVTWRPILLGSIFKVIGVQPLVSVPLKGDYARRDFERSARLHGVPFRLPARFPSPSRPIAAAYYALLARDEARARAFARAAYAAYFVDGLAPDSAELAADLGASVGADRADLVREIASPEVNARLDAATEEARARGVFGSPFVVVDGEPFWGNDRLEMVERWVERGGW